MNSQLSNLNPGLSGQAAQLVVPMKRHWSNVTSAMSPEAATIPTPELFENSQAEKLIFRIGESSLSRSKPAPGELMRDRKSTRLNSSHPSISYAVFCLK